jgi:hypothetical protein
MKMLGYSSSTTSNTLPRTQGKLKIKRIRCKMITKSVNQLANETPPFEGPFLYCSYK